MQVVEVEATVTSEEGGSVRTRSSSYPSGKTLGFLGRGFYQENRVKASPHK